MTRIRLTLENDESHEITSEQERVYDLPEVAQQLVNIDAAVEHWKQEALPELEAKLLRRAQRSL